MVVRVRTTPRMQVTHSVDGRGSAPTERVGPTAGVMSDNQRDDMPDGFRGETRRTEQA